AHKQTVFWTGIPAQAAVGYAAAGYRTIVDGIVRPGYFFEPIRDALRAAGHEVAYAVLRPPLDVCLNRASVRDNRPIADYTITEQIWRQFEDLGELER